MNCSNVSFVNDVTLLPFVSSWDVVFANGFGIYFGLKKEEVFELNFSSAELSIEFEHITTLNLKAQKYNLI